MDKIKNFNNRNDENSEEQLSIIDSLTSIISWFYEDKLYKIENEEKIIAVLLKNKIQIAVIEAPFNRLSNKAYVVNGIGEIIMDVYALFIKKNNSKYQEKSIIFTDAYYIDEELYFFVVINNTDFRMKVDVNNMQLGDLIESR